MGGFEKALLDKANKEAQAILRDAKSFRSQKMKEAKKKAEFLVRDLEESYDKKLADMKKAEEVRFRVELASQKLVRNRELFDKFKGLVKAEIRRNPEALVKFALKNKGSIVRAPKIYKKYLKGFKGKFVEADLDGIEVGDGKVWHVADIGELVDAYFEEHYGELLEKVFG